ncbi:MAG: TfoX/Sxy family protein [Gammaproteobacteria bacterium]
MSERDAFVCYLLDMLQAFGRVSARPMFGGHGIYRDGVIFAIVVDDTLYLKADDQNRALYENEGLRRFSYMKNGKPCFMSYYAAPEEAMEDKALLYHWAGQAYEAGLRGHKIAE